MGIRYKGPLTPPPGPDDEEFDPLDAMLHLETKRTCFYCFNNLALTENNVYWVGDSDIVFHANCARELGQHLIKDGLLAESDAKPLYRKRFKGKQS